ncbi:invasion regulator SirB1 [Erwiniaceae bacterium BAC15a-03b]|uniref:Invasion regulator SirB1 n=1 Tax=Winslowiella arboricola TaxID=2978220 RepID=A0A9J6PYM8_9GAMM|nr:invasion regulator SirB1 [Winslowiella arboricola]MCU5774860.1 invasion regulator SirB1 [Winslowiella arboricola]MCU5779988.1 invasion regulator SirB1 [Winslowiella arboricola]
MTSVAKFDISQSPLCEAVIAASREIRADFPTEDVGTQLQALVAEAQQYVAAESEQDAKLEKLLELFYKQWGFGGASGIYKLSDALWLDNVLKSRQGTAVSLGVILLHIAGELELPLMPVIFPTQLILRADWLDGEMWLINPFNGDTLDEHTLEVWLKGNISPTAELYEDDLEEAESTTVIRKMLDTLKSALMEEKRMEMALNVSNVLLQIDPHDPYEIRDRGLIYAQLECEHIALTDLTYFVEQCPEDPVSEMIKVQIHSIEHKQVTLH